MNSDSSQSIDDILEYLRYMSEKGDIGAQFSLGRVYYDGSRTVARNFGRALYYFGSVARQHWSRDGKVIGKEVGAGTRGLFGSAASYLGVMHMRGEGVPQSFEKAKIWFQRGVDLVNPTQPHPVLFPLVPLLESPLFFLVLPVRGLIRGVVGRLNSSIRNGNAPPPRRRRHLQRPRKSPPIL
jgi:hypothetical protein